MKWFHAARARMRLLAPRAAESRIDEEIRFHIDMETERLVREEKLDPDDARRRARVTFGGVQQHRESLREGRGITWFNGLSLDLKLGGRMLVKYPGLTLVGGLTMAFGIWFGAVAIQMLGLISSTKLPLPEGERIVRILYWDSMEGDEADPVLYDYQLWRSLRSVTELGAWRGASANLVGADRIARPAVAAEVTASAFTIAPSPPLHGRVLEESDAVAGAEPVVLLGYGLWRDRFDGDPRIVGRSVQIGNSYATVVGVMPEGYAFPVSHEMWLPLRADVPGVEPRSGGGITVFGRLATGMTFDNAQAELTSFGRRLAADYPDVHATLEPHVLPYAQSSMDNSDELGMMALIYSFVVVLVVVVSSTVALLLFARAAARETELLVRSALGATRRRIVTQLFVEALVLAGVAAVIGLVAAQLSLKRLGEPYLEMNYGLLPFWYDFNLSPTTIMYALGLAVIAAVVAGVIPARKITRGLGTRLRAGTAGGGVSFGGVWTAVIVTQVALTVMFPAVVLLVRSESNRIAAFDFGFPAREYLGVTISVDGPGASSPWSGPASNETLTPEMLAARGARFGNSLEELRRRLEVEPGVAGVTLVDRLPGDYHVTRRLEVASLPGEPSSWVKIASVHPSYFDVLQAPIITGRAFTGADLSPDVHVAIVDQGFVQRVMPGQNPVGHQVRIRPPQMADSSAAELPWYEIVGVVKELGMSHVVERQRPAAGVYLPLLHGNRSALGMLVQSRGDPISMAPRIRELATTVDADLRIEQMTRIDEVVNPMLWFLGLWTRITFGLAGVALLLSLSGIYAVLSYIVARRTREIGVRVALGASARRVIMSILRRPLIQVTLGVVGGCILIAAATIALQQTQEFAGMQGRGLKPGEIALLVGYAVVMLGVCMLACVVPTIRALRVQPTEALKAE